ncbi:hypothetical protein [Paeniglutamicibacter sp.]|uniref:hypothetical protein n=1 Tax=Paeniglutamicibacter sp. TaxID=1934391 RepID=UPI00398927FC
MAVQQLLFDILAKSDGVDKAFKDIADSADTMAGKLGAAGKKATAKLFNPMTAAAAGGIAGAALTTGFVEAVDRDNLTRELSAALDLTRKQSATAGGAAGKLYVDAYGESFAEVTDAVETVMSTFTGMRNASEADLQSMTGKAMSLAKVLNADVAEAAATVGVMVETGLAKNAVGAMDLLAAASSKVPKAMRGELMPILDEYSKDFKALGITGPKAMGLIVDAADGGAIQMDKTGDAVKEFLILASDLDDKGAQDALKALGLSGKTMSKDLLAGGDEAAAAFAKITGGLQKIKDPTKQASAAVALFGTPLEDIGKDKIPGFLAALTTADGGLGKTAGAADKLDAALSEGPGAAMTELKRTAEDTLASMGAEALPVLQPFLEGLKQFAPVIAPLVLGLGALAVVIGIVNAVMAMSPITWIIVGIIALVAAITLLVLNWDTVMLSIQAFGTWIMSFLPETWSSVLTGIGEFIANAVKFFWEMPQKIYDALTSGNLGELLVGAGGQILDGFLGGLKAGFKHVQDFVGGIGQWIADHKGPKRYDLGLLVPAGGWIMKGLGTGIEKSMPTLGNQLAGVSSLIEDGVDPRLNALAAPRGTGGGAEDFGTMTSGARRSQEAPATSETTFAPVFNMEGTDAEELFQRLWAKLRAMARKEGLILGA